MAQRKSTPLWPGYAQVVTALRRGQLTRQPCEVCGALKVEAHHDSYDRPLDVRWLCRSHHKRLHIERGDVTYEGVARSNAARVRARREALLPVARRLIAAGASISAAARTVGVPMTTLHTWLRRY